jgi:hypothetical protein
VADTVVGKEFTARGIHFEMQKIRREGKDVSLAEYLPVYFEKAYTPSEFYADIDVDLSQMTVNKMIVTDNDSRWLFPEIFRDAIRKGLEYSPFYSKVVVGNESIENTGLTMPYFNQSGASLLDTNEGATISEGVMTWDSKQVTISKRARGLKQTYESIMFCPINLARIYFEDLGILLGAQLDSDLIDILINGDQADGSEAAILMGATTPATLSYLDIVRVWVRGNRINRPFDTMITNEEDAVDILNMSAFQMPVRGLGSPLTNLNLQSPLPSEQNLFVHSDVPSSQIIFVDTSKAVVQLTAMPLLLETEVIVSSQWRGEYASIITGFANIFSDARLILDYSTNITANAGPSVPLG